MIVLSYNGSLHGILVPVISVRLRVGQHIMLLYGAFVVLYNIFMQIENLKQNRVMLYFYAD